MIELLNILMLAITNKRQQHSSLHIDGVDGKKGLYLYIHAKVLLMEAERGAIRSICDNQQFLLLKCNDSETIVIIEP